MTTIWEDVDVEEKVVRILRSVPDGTSPNLPGRPFITAYQLAIEVDARFPEVRQALGNIPLGGVGSGTHTSLAQYLAQRLAFQISHNEHYLIEGAMLGHLHLGDVWFKVPGGSQIRSSNAEAGYDLSLFRLRETR